MRGMGLAQFVAKATAPVPMATLNMRLWPEGGSEHPEVPLRPGDLAVIRPLRPAPGVACLAGWTYEAGVFWKVLDESDGPVVKLTAPFGVQWDAEVWVVPAGSYSLPPGDEGSAVPWDGQPPIA